MSDLFRDKETFNSNIGNWDASNVNIIYIAFYQDLYQLIYYLSNILVINLFFNSLRLNYLLLLER